MTPKDAIYYMKILIEYLSEEVGASIQTLHSLDMATEALQKQIPMVTNGDRCSSCNADVRNWTGDEPFNWCPDCGQRLDWGDEQ